MKILQKIKDEICLVVRPEKPITIWDALVFGIIFLICFVMFAQSSIFMTAGASFGYLNRHFLDFYKYVSEQCRMADVHALPATYLTYAMWTAPLKLFRIIRQPVLAVPTWVLYWYKLLPVFFFLGTGYLVFLISRQLGMGRVKAKLVMYAWLTMPMAFFVVVMGGREEIFPVFFMLLGFYGYLKGNSRQFWLSFMAAGAYHPYALVFFVPLLFLKEKRFQILFVQLLTVIVPFGLEMLVYGKIFLFKNQEAHLLFQEQLSSAGMNNGAFVIQYVVLAYLIFLGWLYQQDMKSEKDLGRMALFVSCMTGMITLGLLQWTPEKLLFAIPFFVVSAFAVDRTKIFHILDMIWMILFVIFSVNYFTAWDETLLISRISGMLGVITPLKAIIGFEDLETIQALFILILIVSTVFKHPHYGQKRMEDQSGVSIGWMRARFLVGMAGFFVPFAYCVLRLL